MNPYYLGGMLVGAIIAVFILSRILLVGTKGWPVSKWKLVYINLISASLSISWAIIGNGISAGGTFANVAQSFAVYGSAQCLVLAFDLFRYEKNIQAEKITPQGRIEPRF